MMNQIMLSTLKHILIIEIIQIFHRVLQMAKKSVKIMYNDINVERSRGILHTFSTSALDGDGQFHAPPTLPLQGRVSNPMNRPQSLYGLGGEEKNPFFVPFKNQTLIIQHVAYSLQ
jgi:hypothetical protein